MRQEARDAAPAGLYLHQDSRKAELREDPIAFQPKLIWASRSSAFRKSLGARMPNGKRGAARLRSATFGRGDEGQRIGRCRQILHPKPPQAFCLWQRASR